MDVLEACFLHHNCLLPMSIDNEQTILAMVEPADHRSIEAMRSALGRPVEVGVIVPSVFEAAFPRLYGEIENSDVLDGENSFDHDDLARQQDGASEAPVVRWVNHGYQRCLGLETLPLCRWSSDRPAYRGCNNNDHQLLHQ